MKNVYVAGIILVLTVGVAHAQQVVLREDAPLIQSGVQLPDYRAVNIDHPIEDVVIHNQTIVDVPVRYVERSCRSCGGAWIRPCETMAVVAVFGMFYLWLITSKSVNQLS